MRNRYLLLAAILLTLFNRSVAQNDTPRTTARWDTDTIKFENVEAGDIFLASFKVTNTGVAPYIINNVKTSCDCTVPRYPTEPLLPGDTAIVTVEFDSESKLGDVVPGIIVYDNSIPNKRHILYLKGTVKPRKKPKKSQ